MTIFVSPAQPTGGSSAEIVDYQTLVQAVSDYWARTDLVSSFGYLIQGAEEQIYNDIISMNDGRGTADMEMVLSGTTDANTGTIPVPTGYLGLRNAQVSFGGRAYPLQRKNVEFIYLNYPDQSGQGVPAFIARQGSNFIFGPFPDAAYSVQGMYWGRATPLSSANTTTWMTASIPSLLLAACNIEAAKYLKDSDALEYWATIYKQKMDSYLKRDKAEMWSGSALAMTPA